MAETDSPRSGASGARPLDDDEPAGGAGPTDSADPRRGATAGGVRRSDLPMREAATFPDLSRLRDGETERSDDGDGGRDAGAGPATDIMPTAHDPSSPSGVTGADRSDTRGAVHAAESAVGADAEASGAYAVGPQDAAGRDAGAEGAHEADSPGTPARAAAPYGEQGDTDTDPEADREAARRAAARDNAVTAKPALPRFLQVAVALFFPVVVVAAAVRAVATSSFLWFEYHRPGFPADRYGFSLDDRMTYGSYALDYVLNFAPPRYLGDLVAPDGEPLFLESEVGHMADVKGVLGLSFFLALVLLVLAVLACVYLARRDKGGIRRALFSGAVLTLVGIGVLTVLAVLAWQTFFTQVHALFFANGTWTFRVDDTLIRLFPEQFWTDSAITVAVLVLAATVLTLVLTWPTRARRERSLLAQDAAQTRYREALDASQHPAGGRQAAP